MPGKANPEFLRRAISLATENVVTGRGGPFAAVIAREAGVDRKTFYALLKREKEP